MQYIVQKAYGSSNHKQKIPKKKQRAKNKRKVPIVIIDMTDDLDLEDLQEREKFDCEYKNYPLIRHIQSNGDNSIRTVKAIPEVKQLKNYSYLTTDIDPSCIDTNQPHTENKSLSEEKMHGQRRSPRQISQSIVPIKIEKLQSPRRSPQRKSSPRKSPRHTKRNCVRLNEKVRSIQGGGEKQLLSLQDNIEGSLANGSHVADTNTSSTSQFLTGLQSLQLSQKLFLHLLVRPNLLLKELN